MGGCHGIELIYENIRQVAFATKRSSGYGSIDVPCGAYRAEIYANDSAFGDVPAPEAGGNGSFRGSETIPYRQDCSDLNGYCDGM